jgi:hypothetical protein
MAVLRLTGSILAPRARRPTAGGWPRGGRAGDRGEGGRARREGESD